MSLPKVPLRLTEGLNRLRKGLDQLPPLPSPWRTTRLTDRELESYMALCHASKNKALVGTDLDEYERLSMRMLDPSRDVLIELRGTSNRWPKHSNFAPPKNDTPEGHELRQAYLELEAAFESGRPERIEPAMARAKQLLGAVA